MRLLRNYLFLFMLNSGFSAGFTSEDLLINPDPILEEKTGLFSSIQDYAISLIFKTLQVFDAFACVSACLREPSCQSVNFGTSGHPKHLCELSQQTFGSRSLCQVPRSGFIHYFPVWGLTATFVLPDDSCRKVPCKNGATCEPACDEPGFRCKCGAFNTGQYCQLWNVEVSSCGDISRKTSYRADMAYTYMIDNKQTDIYCHLSSDLCGSRGWTLAMKTDGSKNTFAFSSPLWSDKTAYNLSAGKTGFDNHETKMPSYWAMPFQSLCVGMKVGKTVGNNLNWALIPYSASSLYDVIAEDKFTLFSIGRNQWMSLIGGSSLQYNCNVGSFNFLGIARLGFFSNDQNDCNTPDSAIGFGFSWHGLSCGNRCTATCSNGEKLIVTFGYILIK
ncbi:uncharacterized protein LOC116294339 [Actinia tenebrosa]|uniref:Uncharacterized protein LOC116294339 n=1 Tax=Actinia tenebrosa TaxID=6105 RepID=A0A6P8HN36_ACTTE|nr:uncharacterized protein LOC116294339 [Actinia tenebrosa]